MRSMLLLAVPLTLLIAQPRTPPVENEFVRVVLGTDRPLSAPGPLHEHKQNRVMIYLDSGDIQLKYADGHVENRHWKAGDIAWSPASGMHTSRNVSSKPVRILEIELRNAGTGSSSGTSGKSAILDNSQVRVYRAAEAPHAGTNFLAVNEKTAGMA